MNVGLGSIYTDAGAIASDHIDGDLTTSIITGNPVNTSQVGVYTITCDVTDATGNAAVQVTRSVNVSFDSAPDYDPDSDGDSIFDLIEAGGPDTDDNGLVDGFIDTNRGG